MIRKTTKYEEKILNTLELSKAKKEKVRGTWADKAERKAVQVEMVWNLFLYYACPIITGVLLGGFFSGNPDFIYIISGFAYILVFTFFPTMFFVLLYARTTIIDYKENPLGHVGIIMVWRLYTRKRVIGIVIEGLLLAISLVLIEHLLAAFFVIGSIVIMYVIPLQARGIIKEALEKA